MSLLVDPPSSKLFADLLPSAPQPPERLPELALGPNPFLADVVEPRVPWTPPSEALPEAITAGKNTYVYDAHTYHTKVPPEGIEELIEYYAPAGGVVLDPFCGSGMTGVAARRRGRRAILSDLSPAAAFIAFNNVTPIDAATYRRAVAQVLRLSSDLEEYLYGVLEEGGSRRLLTNYVVWSFTTVCPRCAVEFVLWDAAKDEQESVRDSKIRSTFACPGCGADIRKRELPKQRTVPVRIVSYDDEANRGLARRSPSAGDLQLIDEIEQRGVPEHLWYPRTALREGVNTRQPIAAGITTIDQAYTTRALWAMSHLWDICSRWPDPATRLKLQYTLTSLYKRVTCFAEYRFWGGSGNTHNLNVPWVMKELNVFQAFRNKAATIGLYFDEVTGEDAPPVRVAAQSATTLAQLPDGSVDYVFTDPPFGANINYSEMNFLWESWLGEFTDVREEAIVNRYQGKGLCEYRLLLERAFGEVRRVLRDDGWMTVVFHNSSAEVWQALLGAINGAGWTVAGSQVFDKKHGTFKQFVSDNAVGYDLVLHCRRADGVVTTNHRPSDETVRAQVKEFVRAQLRDAPDVYRVAYLHVKRDDELDLRRLYSEWLSENVGSQAITLGFEGFRALVSEVVAGG